jgi:hypothetical protein
LNEYRVAIVVASEVPAAYDNKADGTAVRRLPSVLQEKVTGGRLVDKNAAWAAALSMGSLN